jgi:protein-disulfide isomerase/uncharacterized membrane protein
MKQQDQFTKRLAFITGLSAIGAAISIWQTRLFHMTRAGADGSGHTFCNIGSAFDCTAIEMSKYAELMEGFPLSGFAISGYLVILILSLYAFSEAHRQHAKKLLVIFAGIATLFSVAYLAIMVGTIGKFCLLCLGVDLINFCILGLAISLPEPKEGFVPFQKLNPPQMAGIGVSALVAAFLITKATNPNADMKRADVEERIQYILTGADKPLNLPSDTPMIGKPDAPVTIVKFFDFQCPGCKIAANAVHPLLKRYPNEVKFLFLNFPLDMACNPLIKNRIHDSACEAAAFALCASQQGKYEEAYSLLFENQENLGTGKIAELMASIPGIDAKQLNDCATLPSTMEKLKSEIRIGEALSIQSTPTFFLNGKKIEGGLPTSMWIELIDRTLKK